MSATRFARTVPRTAAALLAVLLGGCATGARPGGGEGAVLRVRNHHALAYEGPVRVGVTLPDGTYRGPGAAGEVRDGVARVAVSLPPGAEVTLARTGPAEAAALGEGPLSVAAEGPALRLEWRRERLAALELGLVVVPGEEAGPEGVASAFRPLALAWTPAPDGSLRASAEQGGYRVELTAEPYGGGWLDVRARLVRTAEAAPEYVAVVRRVTGAPAADPRLRFNGRVFETAVSPDTWDRDFWYTHGVDWMAEGRGPVRMLHVNGFAPAPTTLVDSVWAAGSHFYVWERTRRVADTLYLISEVAGPNPEQRASGYMRITPYAPVPRGDAVDLRWRVALAERPAAGWEESQLRGFAGYRRAAEAGAGAAAVDVGVRGVEFGTSYFPYSTFVENFDFHRVAGTDRETWWPFSPALWTRWRAYVPRMRTDLHIIRAMGFDWVRLHHLELLQGMDRAEALAFLDFYVAQADSLGLKVLVDTEGPDEWVRQIAERYPRILRWELENEVLIPGIRPAQPARWTSMYRTVKAANPDAQAFLTGAGANGMFERLRSLGVPFDRVGLHAYKHGPGWEEAYDSHALGTGGYAAELGLEATLGEFNWKSYTRMSPEDRRARFALLYGEVLEPRAIPEILQFHFQETLSVNPRLSRQGVRHYETIALDRRPKPEALELMRLIRQHARPDAPVRRLRIDVPEATLAGGAARAPFTLRNLTDAPLAVELETVAFDGVRPRLVSPARVTLAPGDSARGEVELSLPGDARPGTYHHFIRASFGGGTAYGWGVAARPGEPRFGAPVLGERVRYPQGADVVGGMDWTRPLAVAFGADAPVLEMEMAYLVASTLQAATGRPVHLSSAADLPASLAEGGTVIQVGSPAGNPAACGTPAGAETGVVELRDPRRLCLTGADARGVQAAATDFVLRYWPGVRDAAIGVAGTEPGAALGNRAGMTNPDPP